MTFFDINVLDLQPIVGLLGVTGDLNECYKVIKTHLSNIRSQIFEFSKIDIFCQCFFT